MEAESPETKAPEAFQEIIGAEKKPFYKHWWLWVFIGGYVLLLIAMATSTRVQPTSAALTGSGTDSAISSQSSQAASSAGTVKKDVYGLNDAATYKSTQITLTKVEFSSGGASQKPKDGMEYVVATATIKNVGSSGNVSYNNYDYRMINSKGEKIGCFADADYQGKMLGSGSLKPGESVTGVMVFEQPKGDASLTLQYTGSMFDETSVLKFKIK